MWGSDVDEGTRAQARRATRLPFVPGHVALMPDAHVGIGATVGSVIPTEGAIAASFAGVDLGCGMIATETAYTAGDLPDDLGPLMALISEHIPAGVGTGRDLGYGDGYRDVFGLVGMPFSELSYKQQQQTITQFGTLGSGNHFYTERERHQGRDRADRLVTPAGRRRLPVTASGACAGCARPAFLS